MRPIFAVLLPVFVASVLPVMAGEESKEVKQVLSLTTPFDQGRMELQSSSGAFFSIGGGNRPTLNYSSSSYRLGFMLNTPSGDGFFRGNCEFLIQAFGASVFEDNPGNYAAGAMVLLRYNFVQPESKWAPYVQLGGGMVYNDIYKDKSQRLIGQQWEFDLEAAVGLRYLLNDRWSASIEGGYRHISNADLADRNTGLNSLGVTAGLGLHF